MKKSILFLFFLIGGNLYCQTDLIFPWVTNNANFRGTIILNNLENREADVILVATRSNGESDAALACLGPYEQLVSTAGDLFPGLGEGPGFSVIVTSGNSGIEGAFIIASTGSASGSSPAQANVIGLDQGKPAQLFSYLPIQSSGASAPVVVNLGFEVAEVTFHAYQNGSRIASSDIFAVEPGRPLATLTTDLFPGASGDMFVIAESAMPLVGMAFIFNELLEPSMANSSGLDAVPTANE